MLAKKQNVHFSLIKICSTCSTKAATGTNAPDLKVGSAETSALGDMYWHRHDLSGDEISSILLKSVVNSLTIDRTECELTEEAYYGFGRRTKYTQGLSFENF